MNINKDDDNLVIKFSDSTKDIFFDTEDNNSDLYEHYKIDVDKGQTPLRIDKFLFNRIENVSRNKIQEAAKSNCVLVNGSPVKPNYKVKPLDVISIVLPTPPRDTEVLPEDIPLDIIYEDDDLLVVNKPAGMVVHPAYANYTGTLLNALVFYFNTKETGIKPELVHRIDKDTSGILVVTKNEFTQVKLAKQFYDHTIERKYNALVWGDFKEDNGTINANLGRHPKDRRVVTVYEDPQKGKNAITHYKVLERFGYVTLIECELETGRTHQIRAHLKYLGHPLFGDKTYGGDEILQGTIFSKYKQFVQNCFSILNRQALHAVSLGFVHPRTNKYLQFEVDLPTDIKEVLDKWRRYTHHSKKC